MYRSTTDCTAITKSLKNEPKNVKVTPSNGLKETVKYPNNI